ncbi:MAG: hypothetical protein KBD78_12780 [Oligoflexales bacterium]|nr:hypothetical protein [Oligoflexales bacterium]
MIITKLQCQLQGDNKLSTYHFMSGSGAYRNIFFYDCDEKNSLTILDALQFCFQKNHETKFAEVYLQFRDDAGSLWDLHRKQQDIEYFRNQIKIETKNIRESMLAAILDLDVSQANGDYSASQTYDFFAVHDIAETFHAKRIPLNLDQNIYTELNLDYEFSNIYNQLSRNIGGKLLKPQDYISFCRKSYEMYLRHLELHKVYQNAHLEINFSQRSPIEASRLFSEIQLINCIDQNLKQIETLNDKLRILRSNIEFLEEKIDSLNLESNETNADEAPWQQISELLAELRVSEAIVAAVQNVEEGPINNIEGHLQKFQNRIQTTSGAIAKFVLELENCQTDINNNIINRKTILRENEKLQDEFRKKEPIELLLNGIKKILPLKLRDKFPEQKTPSISPSDAQLQNMVALCTKLGATRRSLEKIKDFGQLQPDLLNASLRNFRDEYEQLISHNAQLRQQWLELVQKYDLDVNLSIDDLMQHLKVITYHRELSESRQRHAETFENYKQLLQQLRLELEQWQNSTDSIKAQKVDNAQAILNEARSIVRFKYEKEKLLQHYNERTANQHVPGLVKKFLEKERENLLREWAQLWQSISSQSYDINDKNSESNLIAAQKLEALQNLKGYRSAEQPFIPIEKILSEGAPIQTFLCQQLNFDEQTHYQRFAKLLQSLQRQNCYLFFSQNKKLFEAVTKAGCGQILQQNHRGLDPSRSQVDKQPNSTYLNQAKSSQAQLRQNELLTPRAKKALEIFNQSIKKQPIGK